MKKMTAKRAFNRKPLPTADELKEMLEYRDSGALVWVERPEHTFTDSKMRSAKSNQTTWNNQFPGRVAGSKFPDGRWLVCIHSVLFYYEEVVAVINGYDITGKTVDFANGNRGDTRIENLVIQSPVRRDSEAKSKADTGGVSDERYRPTPTIPVV